MQHTLSYVAPLTPPRQTAVQAILDGDAESIATFLGARAARLAGSTLLVTGAAGFLPSYLVWAVAWLNRHALNRPCKIVALQRRAPEAAGRLGQLIGDPNVRFLVQDVAQAVPTNVAAEFIVHGASPASPMAYLAKPLDAVDANVWGTRALLERARQWGSRSFVFFSSSEPYGTPPPDRIPTPETYVGQVDPMGPRSVYTETKRMGETLSATYFRQFGVPAKIVRPFHTYGPGLQLDDGRIMGEFLRLRLNNTAIEAKSDGGGIRSFCYLSDATAGYLATLLSDCNGEAFNIGDGREPITVRQLAHMLAEIEEPRLAVRFGQAPAATHLAGTPDRVQPDLTKAERLLGFRPKVGLREGLTRTIGWFRGRRTD